MNKLKWKSKQSIHKVDKRTAQPKETTGIKWDRKRKKQKSKNEQIKMEKQTISSRRRQKDSPSKVNFLLRTVRVETKKEQMEKFEKIRMEKQSINMF